MKSPALKHPLAEVLIFLFALAWGTPPFATAAEPESGTGFPFVTAFSSAEIGGNARSWVAQQDADGVLHFGCDVLASYDGERWRTTPLRDAYALRGLDFGADGRLWFAANGDIGWFARDADRKWSVHSLREHLPPEHTALGEVWNVFATKEGAVFVLQEKILRWDGRSFRVWSMPGGRRLLANRCEGTIYVHHQPAGLYALGAEGPQLVIPAAALDGASVFWMEHRADGWLLATSTGLFVFTAGRIEAFAPAVSEYMRRHVLTSAVRLPDGRLVLGTYRGGLVLARPDGTVDRILTDDDGLPTRSIFSLFVDRDGGLWATSPSHIFRVATGSPSMRFDRRSGLPDLPSLKIARAENGLVVATDRGVYRLQPDGQRFSPVEQMRERLMDLRATERGLVIANFSEVKLVSADRTTSLYKSEQNPFVVQPSRQRPGSLLISVGRAIVLLDREGHSRVLVRDLPDIATSITEDGSGGLWLGTLARGILFGRPDAASPVEAMPAAGTRGLPASGGAGLVVAAPDGAVLAFAQAGGWIMGREAQNFEPIAHFPQREVVVAAADAVESGVWIVHPGAGVRPVCAARIAVTDGHAVWQPHGIEGLPTIGEPRAIFAEVSATEGTLLWIGGTHGIVRNVAIAGPVAPPPRRPLLHGFARGGTRTELQPIAGVLPYSTRSILFEFAAPEFSRRSALRLQTRLDGVDDDWVAAGPAAQREFTAVRDGAYTFRVRVVAETGLVSEASALKFEIAAPWWRTGPAVIGALAAVGLATLGASRWRVRSLRRRNAVLEDKVRERTEQLAQASAAKTQFVANMSHDIRNPLNGIVGLAVALENSRLDGGQREIVATLRECTTYLSSLVDDVLDFASIEAGSVILRPAPFAPAELLRSVVATLGADAAQRGATLLVEVAPDLPPTLLGDAGRIQQILVNYVTNALKYAGGTVRLSARLPTGSSGEIEFAVTDEGPGLTEAEQSVLFTKFTRLAPGGDTPIKGAGLGLASCRLLADIMDGSVGIESRVGHGARFFVRLPLAVCAAPPEAATAMLPHAHALVVEDTDYNAWAAAAVLSRVGLAHTRVRTGAEALRIFSEQRFNVVLLDRNLPDMDGTEVARRMRELEPDGPRAILLAVTAYCTAEDRTRCLEAGMDAFVGKPLTPEKLRRVLSTAGRQLLTAASVHAPADAHIPTSTPAIDLSLLGYLADGTSQGLESQVLRFIEALDEANAQLTRTADGHDDKAFADAAHLVLSHAKFIGCSALEHAAIGLEDAARARDAGGSGTALVRVRREIATLTAALRDCLRAVPSA